MKLRILGLSLVAAFALTAASSALAVSEFHGTKTGLVDLEGTSEQELVLANGGKIVCTSLKGSATNTALNVPSISFLVFYSGCEAFGNKATVTTGEITFFGTGGVSILIVSGSADQFIITAPVAKCSVAIINGGNNTTLKSITYANKSNGTIVGEAKVTGIEYEVNSATTHTSCGTAKEKNVGKYVGNGISSLVGGTIKVS
jgi:hypothetical protein